MNSAFWVLMAIAAFALIYGYLVHKGKIKD